VTAAALDNTGLIQLVNIDANKALLDVTAGNAGFGAAGVLSGDVFLSGNSAIEFKSGQINTMAAGSYLSLNGNDAFVEDSTALGANSALTGLAFIGGQARLFLNGYEALSAAARSSIMDRSTLTLWPEMADRA
jgi:hypothetical protein